MHEKMTRYSQLPKDANGCNPDIEFNGQIFRAYPHKHELHKRTVNGGWKNMIPPDSREADVMECIDGMMENGGRFVHTHLDGSTEPFRVSGSELVHAAGQVTVMDAGDEAEVASELSRLFVRAQAGLLAVIEFGARVAQVEAALEGPSRGPSTKGGGLKGWLEEHCQDIPYNTARRYRDLARGVIESARIESAERLSAVLQAAESDDAPEEDRELYEEVKGLVFGKSARQLMFSFSSGRGPGRPEGTHKTGEHRPITTAEAEAMATEELEGIVRDLGSFFTRHMHLKVVDRTRRDACRLRLMDLADLLK